MSAQNPQYPGPRVTTGSTVLPASSAVRLDAFSTTNPQLRGTVVNGPYNVGQVGSVQNIPNGQVYVSGGSQIANRQLLGTVGSVQPTQSFITTNRVSAANTLLSQGPITPPVGITGSRIRSSIRRDPVEVYTAAGPPLPPLRNTIYNPT